MAKEKTRKDPNEYMKISVEVMKKSIEERKNDKPSPYVGAVLVFPDGAYDTAYRGELREGDHAEYTLLDKKNRHKQLSDCWLFVTLEPCAPGARNAPKISCSERIVNARISELWFGIEDKNPTVDHGGIYYMEESALGMDTFRSLREKYGLPIPIIDYYGSNIVVAFPRTIDAIKKVSLRKSVANLNDEELLGFEFVELMGKLKRIEYEVHFSFDKKKAERHLKKMIEEGLIERKGSGPSTYYQIIET